jgi:hypothetical protein
MVGNNSLSKYIDDLHSDSNLEATYIKLNLISGYNRIEKTNFRTPNKSNVSKVSHSPDVF